MKVDAFEIEKWMNEYEDDAVYNMAETCVHPFSLKELMKLGNQGYAEFMDELGDIQMTYGAIVGDEKYKANIASNMYETMHADNIISMNGAIGANHLVLYTLVEPGDEVICVHPTYQQLHSVPKSLGANVKLLELTAEDAYLPNLDKLEEMVSDQTKLIIINNPNNPTGSVMGRKHLEAIVSIAKKHDAYILADEVYRNLLQDPNNRVPSIVDMYEKGISTGSMSKALSLAGLRLGWIAAPTPIVEACLDSRDYTTISCGVIDEEIAAFALSQYDKILARNTEIIQKNLHILDDWMNREPKMHYTKPQGGTTAMLSFDYDLSSVDFCKGLYELNGGFVAPGSCFGMEGMVRIGYAGDTEILREGLEKFSEYLRTLE